MVFDKMMKWNSKNIISWVSIDYISTTTSTDSSSIFPDKTVGNMKSLYLTVPCSGYPFDWLKDYANWGAIEWIYTQGSFIVYY